MRVGAVSILLVVAAIASSTIMSTAAHGQNPELPRDKIEMLRDLRHQYDEAVAAEAAALAQYELSKSEQERVQGEIETITTNMVLTEINLDRKRAAAGSAEGTVVHTRLELSEKRAQLAAERLALRRHSVSTYVMGEDLALEAFLGANNAVEAMAVEQYSSAALESQTTTISDIQTLESDIVRLAERVEAVQEKAQSRREEVAKAGRELLAQRDEMHRLDFVLGVELNNQALLLDEIRADKADYQRRLTALESDSDGVSAVLVQWQRDQSLGPVPAFLSPLGDKRHSSGFGPRTHPIFGEVRMHNGLDTGAAQGTPIRAAADGTVAMAMTRQGFGNVIVIDHGGRIASLYAHQSAFEVGFGQEVRAGEIIGYVGSTGYSTGPHLHFEVRSFGSPVDPAPYVDHDLDVSCELLIESTHPADEVLLDSREDCRVLLTAN